MFVFGTRGLLVSVHKGACTNMAIVALFVIVKNWNSKNGHQQENDQSSVFILGIT